MLVEVGLKHTQWHMAHSLWRQTATFQLPHHPQNTGCHVENPGRKNKRQMYLIMSGVCCSDETLQCENKERETESG